MEEKTDERTPRVVRAGHELLAWPITLLDRFPRSRRFTLGEWLETWASGDRGCPTNKVNTIQNGFASRAATIFAGWPRPGADWRASLRPRPDDDLTHLLEERCRRAAPARNAVSPARTHRNPAHD